MFNEKNILIDESDDNNFSSRTFANQSSRPLNQPVRASLVSRNFASPEVKKPVALNFNKGSTYDQFNESPEQNSNAKPSYLDRIKTGNPSTLFRPGSSSRQNEEANQGEDFQKVEIKSGYSQNESSGLRKAETVQIGMIRPGSSQSQSNLVRQQFLEQQKQKLKEKQNALIKTNTVTINNKSSTFNNPSFFDDKKRSEDIDYEGLQKVVKQDDREQHEPGTNRKTFNLPGLNKIDHMISFKTQTQQPPQQERLVESNIEELQSTTRNDDVGLLGKPLEKRTVVMRETIQEDSRNEYEGLDDSAQQKWSSQLKETSSPLKPKGKSVKFNHDEDEEDLDAETLKIARQIKALKEGKQQGEIKISLKPEGVTASIEKKGKPVEKVKHVEQPKRKTPNEEQNNDEEKRASEEEVVHAEEAKVDPYVNKPRSDSKAASGKIFQNYDAIRDLREFIINPAPENFIIQCVIRRERTGWGRLFPKYKVFFSNRGTFLLAGKKRSQNRTSNYLISLNPDDFKKKSPNILGKVRSNFLGTEFHLYDTGSNPKKALNFESVRKELGVVTYETNFFGAKGPRKMKVLIPDMREGGDGFYQWRPTKNDDGMLNYFKSGKREGFKFLFNKPPKWNEHIGAFVLNFNGRVDKPSVKNFQLVDEYDDSIIYLQFGRTGNEEFTMDYMWPLTAVQAFGICLSSFDYKIACE